MSVIEVKFEVHGQFTGVRRFKILDFPYSIFINHYPAVVTALCLCLSGFILCVGCGEQSACRDCALALLLFCCVPRDSPGWAHQVPEDQQCLCCVPTENIVKYSSTSCFKGVAVCMLDCVSLVALPSELLNYFLHQQFWKSGAFVAPSQYNLI